MSRVLLVNPPRPADGRWMEREDRCESAVPDLYPPASLCKIAGVLRDADAHDVRLVDLNADAEREDFGPLKSALAHGEADWVVFRSTPETMDLDLRTAAVARNWRARTRTVMLGFNMSPVARAVVDENPAVDFYVTNDDYTEVIRALIGKDKYLPGLVWRGGESPARPIPAGFSEYPMPAWDLIRHNFGRFFVQLPVLHPWIPMETIEGCGLDCQFCVYADMYPRYKRPEDAVAEFAWLKRNKVRYVSFFDATFNLNRARAAAICEGIIREGVATTWYANIRSDLLDEDLVALMARAGCRGVSCGVESGDPGVLANVHKSAQSPEVVERATGWLKRAGIKTYYSFVIGLPGETRATLQETTELIRRLRPNSLQINTFTPYPKTPLYAEAVRRGYKVGRNLVLYDATAADFSMCDLTPAELKQARMDMYGALYGDLGWWASNVAWTLRHPADLKIGANYVLEIAKAKMGMKADHCGPYWTG